MWPLPPASHLTDLPDLGGDADDLREAGDADDLGEAGDADDLPEAGDADDIGEAGDVGLEFDLYSSIVQCTLHTL